MKRRNVLALGAVTSRTSVIERVVNLRCAQARGVVPPQGILMRASKVIE